MNFAFRPRKPVQRKGSAFASPPHRTVKMTAQDGEISPMSDIADIEEYAYGAELMHLSEGEALRRYRSAVIHKAPDSLVVLEDHDCGHWGVAEYSTPEEREVYFKHLLNKYVTLFMSALSHAK